MLDVEEKQKTLDEKLAKLSLPLLKGEKGNGEYTFTLSPNARNYKTMQLKFDGDMCNMTLTHTNGELENYQFMHNGWTQQSMPHVPPYNNAVEPVNLKKIDGLRGDYTIAGNYAWTSAKTLVLRLYWTNWIVPNTFTITLNGNRSATISNDEGYPGFAPEEIKASY